MEIMGPIRTPYSYHFSSRIPSPARTYHAARYPSIAQRTGPQGGRAPTQPRTLGDVVTLRAALAFGEQVHLDVGLVRRASQKVVAHQAVKVVGPGSSGIDLVVDDLGLFGDAPGQPFAIECR